MTTVSALTSLRINDLTPPCKLPFGQRVFIVEHEVNGEKKRVRLNENYFLNGNDAHIGSTVALDPDVSKIDRLAGRTGLKADGKSKYKIVDIGVIAGVGKNQIIFSGDIPKIYYGK